MRFGLIGCGGIGSLRAEAIRGLGGSTLVAAVDPDAERARGVATRHGCAIEADWEALVRRDDVDAVIVSTRPDLHAEMCIGALDAGKHVLCEKPLARTSEECRRIVDAASRSGRRLATGFNYRFLPSVAKARELLDSGAIGELDHVRAYAGYSAREHGQAWIHDAAVMGGGALRDNGVHLIDLVGHFLGDVAEARGYASDRVWRFPGCEDNGFALLRSGRGTIATVQASWTEWRGYEMRVELYGTRGCIRFWCFPIRTEMVQVGDGGEGRRRRSWRFPLTFVGEHLWSYRWVVVRSFVAELAAFTEAVAGKRTALATGSDGLRAIEIAEAAAGG